MAVATQRKSEMTSYLNNGYDVHNCFAVFEKFLPHSIIITSFMSVGSQMPELDQGRPVAPLYKIGSKIPHTSLSRGVSIPALCITPGTTILTEQVPRGNI